MRLGGPVFVDKLTPDAWIAALQHKGYRAAYCPLWADASVGERSEYRAAAAEADIVIAEVGAWSNPLSSDRAIADAAYRTIVDALRLADDIGAVCCVNIAGSRGAKWDGPDRRDMTEETFAMIVDLVRRILSEAAPTTARYTLEPMPWMYPDSAHSYQRLLDAIDHPGFAVHYDPVNMINSPPKYFQNGTEMASFIKALGPRIVSVHAKDIVLRDELTTHLDECIPGDGALDYPTFLAELARLDDDLPLMTEHLKTEAEYDRAADAIRGFAAAAGVGL
ncbi:MAG: sugar phosphate isomerase/epimerase [Spirochaetaceae bacterium]|nr:MAG: sugar phosphate isomerase/epimerase [Spirochaetaceae bacterium]